MLDNPYAAPTVPTAEEKTPWARLLVAGMSLVLAALAVLPFLYFVIVVWPSGWSDARTWFEIGAVWMATSSFPIASSGFILVAVGVLGPSRIVTTGGFILVCTSIGLYVAMYALAR